MWEISTNATETTNPILFSKFGHEGAILKQNPLLINKIIAEKLSDKLQIMMVPSDGKFFFANDVLKSMNMANRDSQADQGEGR